MHGMHKFVTWPLLSCINSRIQSVNSTKCCCWLLFLLFLLLLLLFSLLFCSPVGHCVDDKLYAFPAPLLHECLCGSAAVCVCVQQKKDGRFDPCWYQRPYHCSTTGNRHHPTLHSHTLAHTHGKKGRKGIVWIMRQLQRATFKCQQSATRKVGGSGWERERTGWTGQCPSFFFLARLRLVVDSLTAGASPFLHHHSFCLDSLSHNFHPFPGYFLFSQIVSLEWCHMWRHSETWALTVQRFGSVWLEKHFQVMQNLLATTVPLFANK